MLLLQEKRQYVVYALAKRGMALGVYTQATQGISLWGICPGYKKNAIMGHFLQLQKEWHYGVYALAIKEI